MFSSIVIEKIWLRRLAELKKKNKKSSSWTAGAWRVIITTETKRGRSLHE